METGGQENGVEQTAGSLPQFTPMSWQPAALLDPRGTAASPSRAQPAISTPAPAMNGAHTPDEVIFQFSNPTGSFSSDVSGILYERHHAPLPRRRQTTPVPVGSNGATHNMHNLHITPIYQNGPGPYNGFGSQIERLNNVQERIAVPQPKRRKTQSENDPQPTPTFGGTSNGMLGDHVRHNQQTMAPRPRPTIKPSEVVDLTDDSADVQMAEKDSFDREVVCFGMVEGARINCHKVPAPKPGAYSIGGHGYWPQIKCTVERRSNDPSHLVYVHDETHQVFGTVEARTAHGLARLMDIPSYQVRARCQIPMRRKEPGEQAGQPISRALKFELMLYGPRGNAVPVGKLLFRYGMKLIGPARVDPGMKVVNPFTTGQLAGLSRPTGPSEATTPSYLQYPQTTRTVEEIRSEVMGVFDSLPRSEDLPELEPSDLIITPLLKHQRQALYFMSSREEDTTPEIGDTVVRSIWRCTRDKTGQIVYSNVVTNQTQLERPPPVLGGILADMMGLGKTLSILSLVTKHMDKAVEWSNLPPVQPVAPQKKANSTNAFHPPKPKDFDLTPVALNGKSTLLVCPLSTVTNWEEQIKQHIKPNSLSYHIYHGPNREKNAKKLSQYDLVITTYGSVTSELNARFRGKKGLYPLEEIGWFRIVLDEAHMIREQNTLAFKSICRLQASRRWAVTGTPVQNKLEDLGSLLSFLRLKPFDEKGKFLTYIITPFKQVDPEIVPKLRVLIDTITLRRLKDKINLPKRHDHLIRLKFDESERKIYDWFAVNTQQRVKALTGQNVGHDRLAGRAMIHILRSILQLRLICAHGKDLLCDADLEDLKGMTEDTPIDLSDGEEEENAGLQESKAYELLYLMQEGNGDICAKCNNKLVANESLDAETDPKADILGYMSQGSCFHIYCPACIGTFRRQRDDERCAMCAQHDSSTFVELRRSRALEEHESRSARATKPASAAKKDANAPAEEEEYVPHTKTRALVEDLKLSEQASAANPDEPPFKSVVFSGWTSHLDLIEKALKKESIVFTRLDGKMTRPARTAAMDKFREDPTVHVILVSIMAGGLGLNLTTANTVYVMEPQFNPAAEAQAIDRVHRLGQKREVRTVRYIMEGSFEESMLKLQDKKNKLASLSMDGREKDKVMDRTEAATRRLMDLRSLFK